MMKLVDNGYFPNLVDIQIENITQSKIEIINELVFENITKLSFERGVIDTLDISNFDGLEELIIQNVQLKNFPSLQYKACLKTIIINQSNLTLTDESEPIIPPIVNGIPKRITLDLRNNNIQSLKPFEEFREFFDLNLEGNPINNT